MDLTVIIPDHFYSIFVCQSDGNMRQGEAGLQNIICNPIAEIFFLG